MEGQHRGVPEGCGGGEWLEHPPALEICRKSQETG